MYTMNRCISLSQPLPITWLLPPKPQSTTATKNIASRAVFYWATGLFGLLFLTLWSFSAYAQEGTVLSAPETNVVNGDTGRQFPANARRGTMDVLQGAEIVMDGKAERLSPGGRIRGPNNMLVMTSAIAGQRYTVNFTRDAYGNVHQVWILTELEAQQKIKSATPASNILSRYESDQKTDDGKTPFKDLPKYKQ
jgi:hypothetical protein